MALSTGRPVPSSRNSAPAWADAQPGRPGSRRASSFPPDRSFTLSGPSGRAVTTMKPQPRLTLWQDERAQRVGLPLRRAAPSLMRRMRECREGQGWPGATSVRSANPQPRHPCRAALGHESLTSRLLRLRSANRPCSPVATGIRSTLPVGTVCDPLPFLPSARVFTVTQRTKRPGSRWRPCANTGTGSTTSLPVVSAPRTENAMNACWPSPLRTPPPDAIPTCRTDGQPNGHADRCDHT